MGEAIIPGFEQPERIPLDEHGNIVADVKCLVCGYNLRTQSLQGRCPECGTAVGRSAHGDLLRYCEPSWVETLAGGMNWIVAGIVANVLLAIFAKIATLPTASQGQSDTPLKHMAGFVASLISLVGYWMLTTPNPGQPDDAGSLNLRSVARWCEVGSTLSMLALAILSLSEDELAQPFLAVALAGGIVGLVALAARFAYARRLALRIPDRGLASHTQIVMWGLLASMGLMLPILVVGLAAAGRPSSLQGSAGLVLPLACVCLVGLAVFGIWSLVLIIRYRRVFNNAVQDARSTWATSAAVL